MITLHSAHQSPSRLRAAAAGIAVALVLAVGGCAGGAERAGSGASGPDGADEGGVSPAATAPGGVTPPPASGRADYQLGGAYEPPPGTTVVARDSTAEPADGVYSICYLNGFQTQPGEQDTWSPDLLVTVDGEPLIDPGWPDEVVLDTSTAESRRGILARLADEISGCAASGFQAVEFDNLDSWTRSDGALDEADNVAMATLFVEAAHASGLAAGQKNTGELGARGRDEIGFDFAVAEECAYYDECTTYTDVYGDLVIDIEYSDELPDGGFAAACDVEGRPPLTILRDRALSAPSGDDYVYDSCD